MKENKGKKGKAQGQPLTRLLIVILSVCLVVTGLAYYWTQTKLYGADEPFAELYFSNPDSLPGKVNPHEEFIYSFVIKNNEEQKRTYSYTSGVELYNLYDLTESTYHCLSKFRDKTFLEWTNETKGFKVFPTDRRIPEINPMMVFPHENNIIDWERYTIEFKFSSSAGRGQLAFLFGSSDQTQYSIVIDEFSDEVLFNDAVVHTGLVLKKENNWMRIKAENGIASVYLNDELIYSAGHTDLFNAGFGFASQDHYYTVSGVKAYRDSPFVVPDRGTIIEYTMDQNFVRKKIRELGGLRTKSVRLLRDFQEYNESIDCEKEPFYCNYFDIPNDISFFLKNTTVTEVVEKVPVLERNINYVLFPYQENVAHINWTNFDLSFSHAPLPQGSKGHIILKFEDKWAVMITRNNSYYIRPYEEGIVIDEIRNPLGEHRGLHSVRIGVNESEISLLINDEQVFSKRTPQSYTDGSLQVYVKNVFLSIGSITLLRNHVVCDDPYSFSFCELILESSVVGQRRATSDQQQDFRVDYTEPESQQQSLNLLANTKPSWNNETSTVAFDIPVYNPVIPDRRIVFNTPTTAISYSKEFRMNYRYQSIDGANAVEIGLLDPQERELVSMYVLERQNKIVSYYDDGVHERVIEIPRFINTSTPHTVKLEVIDGDVFFFFDGKEVYRIRKTGIDSGQFFIGSRNTYLELGNVHLYNQGQRKTMKVSDNPCELKPVYKRGDAKEVELEAGSSVTIQKTFTIKRDFDYGRFFVDLQGSSSMNESDSLGIHFWVEREDNHD